MEKSLNSNLGNQICIGSQTAQMIIAGFKWLYRGIINIRAYGLNDSEYNKWSDWFERSEPLIYHFGFLNNVHIQVTPGKHPLLKLFIAPDDKAVAYQAIRPMCIINPESSPEYIKGHRKTKLTRNICSIGGPISNQLSNEVFKPNGILAKNNIELPYRFQTEEDKLKSSIKPIIRYGLIRRRVQNWKILDINDEIAYEPKVNDKGRLETDYLMVTVVPKLLQTKSKHKLKHMIISGTHCVGTLAFQDVFRHENVIKKIDEKVSGEFYQLVAKIDKIEWDWIKMKYVPKNVNLNKIDIKEIIIP